MKALREKKNWPEIPYPGLRPFEITEEHDESLIFFGRENQVFELVDRLAESHLVAVLGPSGCGKSSLVRVGLIPALEAGYLYRAGAGWLTTTMEPGGQPIKALAEALSKVAAKVDAAEDAKQNSITPPELETLLNDQPDALVELSEKIAPKLGKRTNLLILIDQFEELFRKDLMSPSETTQLINLVLNVFHARPDRLYIVITMRTDYLEQCAYYKGLPEALNETQYLTPRLNDEELREAIEKPAQLEHFGGSVEPALVRTLLKELSDEATYDPDRLPLMQHALMCLWQTHVDGTNGDKTKRALKLEHYEAFEGLSDILSKDANTILRGLSPSQRKIAEVMFRLMSVFEPGGRISRRVTTPEEIAAVAGVSVQEVAPVIDAFTSKESNFVRWKDDRTKLDVTHESLIRQWDRVRDWAGEEADAVDTYRELLPPARMWKERQGGRWRVLGGLWRGLNLQRALTWRRRISAEWAARYVGDFKSVERFIGASRNYAILRWIALIIVVALVLGGGGAMVFQQQKLDLQMQANVEADKQRDIAEAERQRAVEAQIEEANQRKIAEAEQQKAVEAQIEEANQRKIAEAEQQKAVKAQTEEANQRKIAEAEQQKAVKAQIEEANQRKIAEAEGQRAQQQAKIANSRRLALVANNNLKVDPELSVLLALEAVRKNVNPEAEDALRQSLQASRVRLTLFDHAAEVTAVAFSSDGKRIVTASDKTAKVWNAISGKAVLTLSDHAAEVTAVAFNPAGTYIATASSDGTAKVWDAKSGEMVRRLVSHNDSVNDITFSPDGSHIATASVDGTARVWDANSGESVLVLSGDIAEVTAVAFSPDGNQIATASFDGTAKIWDTNSAEEILTLSGHIDRINDIAFNPDGTRIVTASNDRTAKMWDADSGTLLLTLRGHTDWVAAVAFSPDGSRIATASYDGTAKVWDAPFGQELFMLRGHIDWVTGIAFNPDGSRIATASHDGTAKVWDSTPDMEELPSNVEDLTKLAKKRITRELSAEERQKYLLDELEHLPMP